MSVSPSFRIFVLEQLARTSKQVKDRAMFGGIGIYCDDLFFALIAGDTLYFKVDDTNRPDFEARGMGPFRPAGPDGEVMQYYAVPEDLLEDPEALRPWVDGALAVARRKKARGRERA
ncbi:MAG TPA: TfoX/Sxy family protein [Gemmatimonadales bacterium]|jgi:DNA transformation protein|nr:TfoX/Sxy family protein [Gemmatimonadales bacterium]